MAGLARPRHHWDTFTTNRGTALTPVAAEISDLTLWAGRLAHTGPAWTPARTHASQPRTHADFTGHGTTITDAVTALHHTSDALTPIAAHDRGNVRAAAASPPWLPSASTSGPATATSDSPPASTPSSAASKQRGAETAGNHGDDQDQAAARRSRDGARRAPASRGGLWTL
jgi:hypothetical protein